MALRRFKKSDKWLEDGFRGTSAIATSKRIYLASEYLADDATRIAAMNLMANTSNVAFSQVNQFLRANVQVNQGIGTLVAARGVVASDDLANEVRRAVHDDAAAAAARRRYDIGMRKAREILEDAMAQGLRERRERVRAEKRMEVMYFEMRDRYLPSGKLSSECERSNGRG
jgi:hypothetical protein